MVEVNVMGLLHGIAAALPHFTRQGAGHLVTMASVGAHEVPPTSAVYSGTKHARGRSRRGCASRPPPGSA